LEDIGIDGRIILNRIFKKWDVGMDWIDITQDRYGIFVFENAKMNLRFP